MLRFLFLFAFSAIFLVNCGYNDKQAEDLAKSKCSSCHQFPEPSLLPKSQWEKHVLPQMAYFMGVYANDTQRDSLLSLPQYQSFENKHVFFPELPTVTADEWKQINNYYLKHAPAEWKTEPMKVNKMTSRFRVIAPPTRFKSPSTTMVKFGFAGELILGDVNTSRYYELRNDYSIKRSGELEEGAVWADHVDFKTYVLLMGSFSPDDAKKGMVVTVPDNAALPPAIEIDSLRRPVDAVRADLNADGIPDFVVCEFGRFAGGLNVYFGNKKSGYTKKNLWSKPGATAVKTLDINGDGLTDVLALFAQADEGIDAYINQGNGEFLRQRLISFPPSFGSSGFQMVDFDHDGDMDIVYTAGDNADFFPVVKPYHGIYLYRNEGKGVFRQHRFLYMPGAYKALMNDFDLDGDLDIAAISFFPDFSAAKPVSFALFVNQGDMRFVAESPDIENLGRWIVMDAADKDGDGDADLVLGSLLMEPTPKGNWVNQWQKQSLPFIILENTGR